ncbi:hypothetical protein Pmar_PMAR008166 [Perkinsus marinus ATCC 50983]|uniref:Phosphoglycerate mutase n=1 Tax=Perkinsus marinus (strain ATCC 50983 / TXsc) TaxID=423536 RepID=C5LNF1_PERM5|nr:hypothetical protein Pmar_PMAR008166 [Perkinsus marinus ATCC 50983]EER01702.1 hypothetical protein Pmar_PMAR008166 [Perkinsus marinus ATCC 50983]|eukprot:XP_002768984.1 hypothetical protein Pmar_PMAR008166 [Perkinsus marinus ATCC 50983]
MTCPSTWIFIRHSKSPRPADPSPEADQKRVLGEEGRLLATKARSNYFVEFMDDAPKPVAFVSSPAARCLQTADAMLGGKGEFEGDKKDNRATIEDTEFILCPYIWEGVVQAEDFDGLFKKIGYAPLKEYRKTPESKAIVDNYGEVAVGKICEILPEETETVVVFGHAMGLAAMALQLVGGSCQELEDLVQGEACGLTVRNGKFAGQLLADPSQ